MNKTMKSAGRWFRMLIASAFVVFALPAFAEQDEKDRADTFTAAELLPLAALLIKDGNYGRALKTLEKIDKDQEELDKSRFYSLLGMAQIGLKDFTSAKASFTDAINNGQREPVIFVYLAQANYGLKDYRETLAAIDRAGADQQQKYPALLEMKTQSHWQLKQYDQAWDTLTRAEALFPDNEKFLERRTFYALELGLYRHAAELGREYLTKSTAKAEDFVAIGNALRLSRQLEEAAEILEIAHLSYPEHAAIAKVLAHTYLDQGMTHAAAAILEQAARYHPQFIAEAAELYKRAGRYHHALELNARTPDQATKLRQRLALLLALKKYELAVVMETSFYRARLLDDQNIRYALAYAAYAVGKFDKAKKHLAFIKDPNLFKQAVELKRLMQECETERWQCV